MKTAREYASEYREIAKNLGMQGDSTELLIQMLSHFTYTNEVENIAYANEASLERALLGNSKIQHCVEVMYSVFRGRCPRVIFRFRPTKFFDFGVYDRIVSLGSFGLYYLGYLGTGSSGSAGQGLYDASLGEAGGLKFTYAPVTIQPSSGGYVTILCLLATKTIESEFTLSDLNKYYVDIPEEGLSHDMSVQVSGINVGSLEYTDTTREFQKHLLDDMVFDLTLPGFGSRLYLPESMRTENTRVKTLAFRYVTTSELNSHDLRNIKMDGADPVGIHDTETDIDFMSELEEVAPGVVLIPELPQEDLSTVHYAANKDRFMGSILRSNSDVSDLLKEMYPLKVKSTSYVFDSGISNKTKTVQNSVLKADTVLKGNVVRYVGSGDYHVDINLDIDTLTDLTVHVKKTNEVVPATTTYSIQSESPISKLGYGNTVYVLKTYLDDDNDLVTSVIPIEELESEKLALQYRYGRGSQWTTITDGQIPARPVQTVVEASEAKTESASKITETTTSGDDVTTKVTESESTSLNTGQSVTTETEVPETTEPLYLQLLDKSGSSWRVIDSEYLPYISETTTYFGITDKNYLVPVNGKLEALTRWPVEIPTVLFIDGAPVKAESYEILSSHKLLQIEVTPEGIVRLLGFKENSVPAVGEFTAVIRATVSGIGYTCTLKVSTTAVTGSDPRVLEIYYKISENNYTSPIANYQVWSGSVVKLTKDELLDLLPVEPDTSSVITLGLDCKDSGILVSQEILREKALTDVSEVIYSSQTAALATKSARSAVSLLDSNTATSSKLNQAALSETTTSVDPLTKVPESALKKATILTGTKNTALASTNTNKTFLDTRENTSFGSLSEMTLVSKEYIGRYVLDVPEITLGSVLSTNKINVTTENPNGPVMTIYYVPQNSSDLLSDSEKNRFLAERSSYYITDNIQIQRGTLITATLDIRVVLYQNISMDAKISEILDKYRYNFGLDTTVVPEVNKTRLQLEIESQIAKLSNIAEITSLIIRYRSEDGTELTPSQVSEMSESSYFEFSSFITTDLISYT